MESPATDKPIRALLLTRYGYEGASSRYRALQYIPHLENAGIECIVQPFFQAGFTALRFSNRKALVGKTLEDYIRRVRVLRHVDNFNVIFVEKEIFPYLPSALELSCIARRVPYVCDYDDAWFHVYDEHNSPVLRCLLRNKLAELMAGATTVIVGSKYLYDYAIRYNMRSVHLLPTVINLEKYPAEPPKRGIESPFTIGWIGSVGTVPHLKLVEKLLNEFCDNHFAKVVVIGDNHEHLDIRSIIKLKWSESTEIQDLSAIDVGIMPLPDTDWAKGKCALKLIQYMGCWKPTIASRVGENVRVVKDGVTGFLVGTPSEWLSALHKLYENRELGNTMGVAGRAVVESKYSVSVVAPRLINILKHAACGDAKGEYDSST